MKSVAADPTAESSTGLAACFVDERAALRRFLVARIGRDADADDVLQDMWLRLARGASGPVGNPRAYLFRMAQNMVLDRVREARRREVRDADWADVALDQRSDAGEPATTMTAETRAIDRQEIARLAAAIALLPPGAGRAFRLHKLEGLSHAETAAQMGISRKGVEKHIATAMLHLRRTLREDDVG